MATPVNGPPQPQGPYYPPSSTQYVPTHGQPSTPQGGNQPPHPPPQYQGGVMYQPAYYAPPPPPPGYYYP